MRKILILLLASSVGAIGQSTKVSLQVTSIAGINSGWIGEGVGCPNAVDNRSYVSRRNVYHALWAVGVGAWTAKLQYSNVSCTGPWSDYPSTASISQASSPAIAFANDVYGAPNEFIKVVLTGSVTVTYVGQSQLPLSPAVGSVTFPCTVAQGCTGISAWTPQYSVYQAGGAGVPVLDAVHLDQPAAVTGVLPKGNETMPAWSDVTGAKQGNTNVPQMAGTNSGALGAGLCNDVNGNTTTTGCSGVDWITGVNNKPVFDARQYSGSGSTGGIQEAINAAQLAGGGMVIAGGPVTVTVNANITISGSYITLALHGVGLTLAGGTSIIMSGSNNAVTGDGGNLITASTTGGDIIKLIGCSNCSIRDIILDRIGTAVAGANGIDFVSGVSNQFLGSNIRILHQYKGILAQVSMIASQWTNVYTLSSVSHGIELDGTNDEHFSNLFSYYNGGHAFQIGNAGATLSCIGGVRLSNFVTYSNSGDGLHIEGSVGVPCTYIFLSNTHLDSDTGYELYAKYAGAITVSSAQIVNGKGVYLDNASAVQFAATRIQGSSQEGILITNNSSRITGSSMVIGDFSMGNASTYYGIRINNSVTDVNFSGLAMNAANVGGFVAGGIKVETGTGAPSGVRMTGVHFVSVGGNLTAIDAALTDVVIDAGSNWITLTGQNSWGGGLARLENNGLTVRLETTIAAGTTADGTVICTLPVGLRPSSTRSFPVTVVGAGGTPIAVSSNLVILANGNMQIYGFGANNFLRLDSITFSTD